MGRAKQTTKTARNPHSPIEELELAAIRGNRVARAALATAVVRNLHTALATAVVRNPYAALEKAVAQDLLNRGDAKRSTTEVGAALVELVK